MTFDEAFVELLEHEGGFSDHKDDPGGKTQYGITEAVAREVGYRGDMRDLPVDLAKRIYLERYWKPVRGDELPDAVRYIVFDAAVNSGPKQSIMWLQRALGVNDDGILGPKTMAALSAAPSEAIYRRLLGQRLRMQAALPTWPAFGRGWARRIAALLEM